MSHNHTIIELIEWAWFGVLQWVKWIVPAGILTPDYVGRTVPSWFREVKSTADWRNCVSSDGYPEDCWFGHYFEAVALQLGNWIEEIGPWARDAAYSLVRGFTGYVLHGYVTFSDWIDGLGAMIGAYVPLGVATFTDAVLEVWYLIPFDVRYNFVTWVDLFQQSVDDAITWALGFYANTVAYAYGAYNYVLTVGEEIKQWYYIVNAWVSNFMADPYGTVTDALSEYWTTLRLFAIMRIPWYNWLHIAHRNEIEDFFNDPITWLYDQLEDWILEHIW